MKPKPLAYIGYRDTAEIVKKLKKVASKLGVRLSDIIRQAIREFLERNYKDNK